MDIGDALLAELGGAGETAYTTPAAVAELVAHYGSLSRAARALDVPRSTLRGWRDGRSPKMGGGWLGELAREVSRRARLSADDERRLREGLETVEVDGTLSISDDEARVLVISLIPGFGDAVVDAYLAGADADELGRIFLDYVADPWYADALDPGGTLGDVWDTNSITPRGARV